MSAFKEWKFYVFWLLYLCALQINFSKQFELPFEIAVIKQTNVCDVDLYLHRYNNFPCINASHTMTLIRNLNYDWFYLPSVGDIFPFDEDSTQIRCTDRYTSKDEITNYILNITVMYSTLNDIPSDLLKRAKYFTENLNIETISVNDFSDAKHLIEINLARNLISKVPSYAFRGANKLTKINLMGNRIHIIEPFAFALEFSNLSEIDLSWNFISEISHNAFPINLTTLLLNNNAIKEISSDLILNLQTLVLDNNNHLSVIPRTRAVNLSLQNTSTSIIEILHSTLKINAANSNIQEIKLINISNFELQTLNLHNNSLNSTEWLPSLTNLLELDVSLNQLVEIDAIALSALTNIHYLNFSNNKLLEFDQSFLVHTPELESLDLSYNNLKHFRLNEKVYNLKTLGIAGNGLMTLDTNLKIFAPLLQSVKINNNDWSCSHLLSSLLLLKYDSILPIDNIIGETTEENYPNIGYVKGIRCVEPLTKSSKMFSTIDIESAQGSTINVNEVDKLVNERLSKFLEKITNAFETKLRQLDAEKLSIP